MDQTGRLKLPYPDGFDDLNQGDNTMRALAERVDQCMCSPEHVLTHTALQGGIGAANMVGVDPAWSATFALYRVGLMCFIFGQVWRSYASSGPTTGEPSAIIAGSRLHGPDGVGFIITAPSPIERTRLDSYESGSFGNIYIIPEISPPTPEPNFQILITSNWNTYDAATTDRPGPFNFSGMYFATSYTPNQSS